jgi:tRNA threonylcarbamoyladenosine biosynthesis protein TsaE
MTKTTQICKSEEETAHLAARIAQASQCGDVYALIGPMGAGKSAFARGFIRALCGNDTEVPSPTYNLVQTYDSAKGEIWHFDLYRLKTPEEVLETGWDDAMDGSKIILIEWPEKAGSFMPQNAKKITLDPQDSNTRHITVEGMRPA